MTRRKYGWLWPALIIATLIFIWGNSLLSASLSSIFSNWVRALINWLTGAGSAEGAGVGHGLLRKLAHGTEFALLGAEILFWQRRRAWRALPTIFLSGVTTAVMDETIQLFSPGRASRVVDIWIDLAGFACGVCGALLILWCKHTRVEPRKPKTP